MAANKEGLYREKSLEKLHSPDRLDQLLQTVGPKSWIPLLALSLVVAAVVLWAVFGRIPIVVNGKGILVYPRKVVDFQAPGSGNVTRLLVRVGDTIKKDTVLARISQPELEKQLELQQAKLTELTTHSQAAELLRSQRAGLEAQTTRDQSARLEKHISASKALAEDLREKSLQSVQNEKERLQEQLALARNVAAALKERYDGQKKLFESGILSRDLLIEAEKAWMDSLTRVSNLDGELKDLRSKELEAEQRYLDRLQQIANYRFELEGLTVKEKELAQENQESASSYERQISDVQREIDRLNGLLEKQGSLKAENNGRILEVDDPESRLVSLNYFMVKDGKKLEKGMSIQVTPDTVERQRFGSIQGTITSVSSFPVSAGEVENVVGNKDVAEALIQGGYYMEVFAELQPDPATRSGYRWTSSKGPPVAMSAGTTSLARVVVEQRSPITFVLPIFKSAVAVE
jgi:HlyD family secretion protein